MDVEPTAQIIDDAAEALERAAKDLRHRAVKMRADGDITHTAEAVSTIVNIFANIRLDLLVTRPLRAAMQNR
jgi:hypothetical protein